MPPAVHVPVMRSGPVSTEPPPPRRVPPSPRPAPRTQGRRAGPAPPRAVRLDGKGREADQASRRFHDGRGPARQSASRASDPLAGRPTSCAGRLPGRPGDRAAAVRPGPDFLRGSMASVAAVLSAPSPCSPVLLSPVPPFRRSPGQDIEPDDRRMAVNGTWQSAVELGSPSRSRHDISLPEASSRQRRRSMPSQRSWEPAGLSCRRPCGKTFRPSPKSIADRTGRASSTGGR